MKKKVLKVSVIIPVYNTEKYLRQCLDSVINQTLKEIEIICVNDGSTDNSLSILEEYAKQDKRIKVIDQVNKGLGAARNTALLKIKGEYVYFLDSDDYIDLNALSTLYKFSCENDLQILQFNGYNFKKGSFFEENGYWNSSKIPESLYKTIFSFSDIQEISCFFPVTCAINFYKKTFLLKNHICFSRGIFFEDNEFFLKAVTQAERISRIKDKLVYHRIHPESIMGQFNKHIDDFLKMSSIILEYIHSHNFEYQMVRSWRLYYYNLLLHRVKNYFGKDKKRVIQKAKKILEKYNFPPHISELKSEISPLKTLFESAIDVSIIIPVKTFDYFFRVCLKSILHQTFSNFEVLCICDGDNECVDVLKEMASKDTRIKPFFLKESHGAGYCRNLGISLAQGRYIQFLDSDDWFDRNMLQRLYEQAQKYDADITLCSGKYYDQVTKLLSNKKLLKVEKMNGNVFSKDTTSNIFDITPSLVWNRLYKASFIRQNHLRFQEISSSNDTAFAVLSLILATRVTYVNKPFIYYRVNQMSNTTSGRDPFNSLKVCRFILDEFNKRPFLAKYKRLLDRPFKGFLYYELSFPHKLEQQQLLINSYVKYLSNKTKKLFLPYLSSVPISVISIVRTYRDLKTIFDTIYHQSFQQFDWIVISCLSPAELDFWVGEYFPRMDCIIYTNEADLFKEIQRVSRKVKGEYIFVHEQKGLYDKDTLCMMTHWDKKASILSGQHVTIIDDHLCEAGSSLLFKKNKSDLNNLIIPYLNHQLNLDDIPNIQYNKKIITFSLEHNDDKTFN